MAAPKHRLGDLQLRIMKVLWETPGASVAEIHKEVSVPGPEELATTTVATMLRKMEAKGLVRHREQGRKFLYEAAVAEEDVSRSMATDVLDRVFEGSLADMVGHLLQRREVSNDELDRLARLIEARKRRT